MRIEKPTVFTPSPDGPRSLDRPRAVDRAWVVPIAEALSALVFDAGPGDLRQGGSGRLGGEIGGEAFPKPVISTRLALRRGGWRHVLLVSQEAGRLARTRSHLTIDGAQVAAIDPTWLQSPLADLAALIDGLTDAGRDRLLRMLATTGASLFGSGGGSGFGAAIHGLVRAFGLPELRVSSRVALGRGAMLLSCRLPASAAGVAIDSLVAVSDVRVSRVVGHASTVEAYESGALLHLIVPAAISGRTLLATGPRPMTLDASTASAPRPIGPWFARRSPATRAWALRALKGLADGDATVAALLRELHHRDAPPPVLDMRHLSAAPGGLLLFGELRDPNQMVEAVRIEGGGMSQDIAVGLRRADGRPVPIGGLIAASKLQRTPARCRLRLVYASGRVQSVGDWPVAAFDGGTPAGFGRLGLVRASTEMAAARLSRWRRGTTPTVETIGTPPPKPVLALVAPAGVSPDMLRARAALLFAEAGAEQVELIHHAGAGEAEAVSRLLEEINDVFGIGGRLLIFSARIDPAERLRVALESVRSPAALVLGASALPEVPGWLGVWRTALAQARGPAIRGGTLLAPDGAVIDAGGDIRLDRARNDALITRRGSGLPASLMPAEPMISTSVVSADCVGLSRRAIAALGRLSGHYPEPDALLLALAHRFRRGRGASVTMLNARFVRFEDDPGRDPIDVAATGRAIASLVQAPGREGRAR